MCFPKECTHSQERLTVRNTESVGEFFLSLHGLWDKMQRIRPGSIAGT